MQTMMTTIKRGRNQWDRVNMPISEFQARVNKIQAEMARRNLTVLLVYGIGPDEYGDPCYLTNFVPVLGANIAVVPQSGKVTLIFMGSARGIEYERETTWIDDLRPNMDIIKECLEYLKDNQLISGNIGLAGFKEKMPHEQLQALYESCRQSNFIDAGRIIKDMRAVKATKEQDQIKRSSMVLDRIISLITNTAFTNPGECQIEAVMDREARLEGAEDFRLLIAKPQEAKWAFRPVEAQPVNSGDTIIIYAAVARERYWADCIRTFKAEGSRLELINQPAFAELYRQITRQLQPGKPVSQFYRETMTELQKRKVNHIADYGLGQGIGLSPQEMPILNDSETSLIKRGMCFSLRLGLKEESVGAMMIGDTICLDS